jgi:hypothetical protein
MRVITRPPEADPKPWQRQPLSPAARGIGRACALALAEAGFDIALVDLLEAEMAATARDIEARGRRALLRRPT